MRINCPQCHAALNVVDVDQSPDISCPSCGSRFPLGEITVSYRRETFEQIGHFDLLESVGSGQFGTVWKGHDRKLNRVVAIKIPRHDELTEAQHRLFLREAQAAAKLDHPNVVRVFEVQEEKSQIYIVTQFINGTTLRELIKNGQMSIEQSVTMMATIADAVHHAHEAGVIHRDIKPSNILVDIEGHPFVSDFGLAKLNSAEVTVTVTGVILGTPAYMSPE